MTRRIKGALIAATVVALAGAGAGLAAATGDDDASDKPIRGDARDRAGSVALEHTGGGRVTETEVGDEEGFYEVEVTRDDGSQVDVHLDRGFNVLGDEADEDGAGDDDS
jgi:uncharacterized membrane protein YkoI